LAPPALAAALVGLSIVFRLPAVLGYDGPPAPHPFNLFEMARVGAYSDVAHLYFRDRLWANPVPYFDFRFEYPVLTGAFVWLASAVGGASVTAYLLFSGGLLAACAGAATALIRRVRGANPWLFAAAPAIAFYGVLNWDLFGIALFVGAVVLFERRRDTAGGALLALATCAKLFPVTILPVVLAVRLAERRVREAIALTAAFVVVTIAVNAPFAVDPHASGGLRGNWLYFFRFNEQRPPRATIWKPLIYHYTNVVTTPLFVVGFVAILVVAFRARRSGHSALVPGSVAALLWMLAITKVYSPQYALWIFAGLALVSAPLRLTLGFAAIDVLIFVTTFGPLYPGFGPFAPDGVPLEIQWGAYGARQVFTVVLAAWVVRERLLLPRIRPHSGRSAAEGSG
jgi:hypothetical protein